jgi:hypothetical protein
VRADELVAAAATEAFGGGGAAVGLRAICLQLPADAALPAAAAATRNGDGDGGGATGSSSSSHAPPPHNALQRMAAAWSAQKAEAAAVAGAEAERYLLRALPWAGVRVALNQAPAS